MTRLRPRFRSQSRTLELLETRQLLAADSFATAVSHNTILPADVTQDGVVSPLDMIVILNYLDAAAGSNSVASTLGSTERFQLDVNGDQAVSPIDAILVLNYLDSAVRSAEAEDGAESEDGDVAISIGETSQVIYDRNTGELRIETTADVSTLEIMSASDRFLPAMASNLDGNSDEATSHRLLKTEPTGFGSLSFGPVLPVDLAEADVLADLSIYGETLSEQVVSNRLVRVELQITDADDLPVSELNVGDTFYVKAIINDHRPGALVDSDLGIFAA